MPAMSTRSCDASKRSGAATPLTTKTPKLHFLDAGLLAALRDFTPDRLRADQTPFGALLETIVLAELEARELG